MADLVERSRENTERLLAQVRKRHPAQVGNLGLATKSDIARLERQIAQLKSPARSAAKKATKRGSGQEGASAPRPKAAANKRPRRHVTGARPTTARNRARTPRSGREP